MAKEKKTSKETVLSERKEALENVCVGSASIIIMSALVLALYTNEEFLSKGKLPIDEYSADDKAKVRKVLQKICKLLK